MFMSDRSGVGGARSLADCREADTLRKSIRRERVRRARVAARFPVEAGLAHEVADRLLDRLDCLQVAPEVVLNLAAADGAVLPALRQRFPKALLLGLDVSEVMLARAPHFYWRKPLRAAAAAQALPLEDASVDLVFANLVFPWASGEALVFAELRRVLRPGGALFLSALGRVEWPPGMRVKPAVPHCDLTSWTGLLVSGGFSEPVLERERLSVEYAGFERLSADVSLYGGRIVANDVAADVGGGRHHLGLELHFLHAICTSQNIAAVRVFFS
jgi:malonyl-CoA O-methyltransferase